MTKMTKVSDRPIQLSGPMVRAVLGGSKTQTRRAMKMQPHADWRPAWYGPIQSWKDVKNGILNEPNPNRDRFGVTNGDGDEGFFCPYGQPGDRLWVQEAYGFTSWGRRSGRVTYECLSDGAHLSTVLNDRESAKLAARKDWQRRQPGRFMYRSCSRITLEITDVRVERLREISVRDCVKEGIERAHPTLNLWRHYQCPQFKGLQGTHGCDPMTSFKSLWDSANAGRSFVWSSNPWVWVVSFNRVFDRAGEA